MLGAGVLSALSRNEKRQLLRGCVCTTIMLNPICNTTFVHCREVVLFSEGPLSEARLYTTTITVPGVHYKYATHIVLVQPSLSRFDITEYH